MVQQRKLRGLNDAQREAVCTLRGPLLVLAGAGTGKTRVVTYRVAELIRSGTRPDRILAVTFTRKAAGEMHQRAMELLGTARRRKSRQPRPEISTFHSLCVRILRRHIDRLGYPKNFTVFDRNDQESQARQVLREVRAPNDALKPADLLAIVSRWKASSIRPHQAVAVAETDREHLAAVAYRRYQKCLKSLGATDFDDLLLLTEELFADYPDVRLEEAKRFDHLLIDEYQDTNRSQYEIVKSLADEHRNLCVVGDDDQSIYGWRGAEVAHILQFERDWPDAKIVRLEQNYRSTAAILSYANDLITFNRTRHEKVLRAVQSDGQRPNILQCKDETDEAHQVVSEVEAQLKRRGVQPRDIAILFRTNEQPRAMETELRHRDVPYVLIGGMSFFDRREVRDLLAYLRLAANPDDEPSLRRILNRPPRGIGGTAQARLLDFANEAGESLWSVLQQAAEVPNVSEKSVSAVHKFCDLIDTLHMEDLSTGLGDFVKATIDRTGYRDEIARQYADSTQRESRLAALEEIVNAAANYDQRQSGDHRGRNGRLRGFLDDIMLSQRDDSEQKDEQLSQNGVALMTLHSAKGLEFRHVFLVGLEEGILPHKRALDLGDDAIDEERRLCYVGITRAQERLTLSFALTRRKWGKPRDTQPSRFLYEMTGQADNPRVQKTRHQPKVAVGAAARRNRAVR